MNKQVMQKTHTAGKLTWALPLLLASLSACVGPVREGEANWEDFAGLMEEGRSEIDMLDAEIAALEAELLALNETELLIEDYIEQGTEAGEGDVAKRWRRMKEIESRLEQLRQLRLDVNATKVHVEGVHGERTASLKRDVDGFLEGAWKRTEKGSKNIHVNYGFGARTDGALTLFKPDGTLQGVIGAETMRTDSADIGAEYYVMDNLAVEAGIIFSHTARGDTEIDFQDFSPDEETLFGTFVGAKYCIEPVNASGGGGLNGRTRLFVNARLGMMNEFSVTAENPGAGSDFVASGEAYLTLSLGAGVLYAWTDHIAIELGFNVVNSLSDIEGDWGGVGTGGTYETDLSMTRGYLGVLFGF